MKTLLSRLNLNQEFYFSGQRQDLELALKSAKGIYYQFESENELKFYPRISWGTLSIIGFEINVQGLLSKLEDGKIKINFKTRLRYEHLFLIAIFIVVFAVITVKHESIWGFTGVFGLWIICHLWSQAVFRYQENKVIDNVVEKLRLTEV